MIPNTHFTINFIFTNFAQLLTREIIKRQQQYALNN